MGRTLQVACLMLLVLAGSEARAARPEGPGVRVVRPHDDSMALAIEEELARQPGVRAQHLDVTVRDGVAIVSGHVEDLLSRERALRIARALFGVRAVVDLVEVRVPERSDLQLAGAIRTAWALDGVVESHQLGLEVRDGVVRLRGTVDSDDERLAAERAARGIPGVRAVESAVVVQAGGRRSDGEIREEVRGRLRWEPGLPGDDVDVQVRDGRVTLSGRVGTEAQRERAGELAWAEGARHVVNRVEVDPSHVARALRLTEPRVLDAELVAAVRAALAHDPRVGGGVAVAARDGVVRLSGAVDGDEARRAALDAAGGALGCRQVEDALSVRPRVAEAAEGAPSAAPKAGSGR